jgi:hypothetical protein
MEGEGKYGKGKLYTLEVSDRRFAVDSGYDFELRRHVELTEQF